MSDSEPALQLPRPAAALPPAPAGRPRRWWEREHVSTATAVLRGVDPMRAWRFLRDPASAMVLLPDVVAAAPVDRPDAGECVRYVCREGRHETVSVVAVTASVPGRLLELSLLDRPYSAVRRFEVSPLGDGTLLTVSSWARAGWAWTGVRRMLQDDDEQYVERVAQVLPVLTAGS